MSGMTAEEAATMFTAGIRAGVVACVVDVEEAVERLTAKGDMRCAAQFISLGSLLKRHIPTSGKAGAT